MLLLPHQVSSPNWDFGAKSRVLFLNYLNCISPLCLLLPLQLAQLSSAYFLSSAGGFVNWTSVGQVPTPATKLLGVGVVGAGGAAAWGLFPGTGCRGKELTTFGVGACMSLTRKGKAVGFLFLKQGLWTQSCRGMVNMNATVILHARVKLHQIVGEKKSPWSICIWLLLEIMY